MIRGEVRVTPHHRHTRPAARLPQGIERRAVLYMPARQVWRRSCQRKSSMPACFNAACHALVQRSLSSAMLNCDLPTLVVPKLCLVQVEFEIGKCCKYLVYKPRI